MAGAEQDPGYCLFLAERLLELLPGLREEAGGVRLGTDIEYVHRMRVASRRLRALLPLLAGCVRPRELRRWRRAVRSVTRALGAARDADVQLEHLVSSAGRPAGGRGDEPGFHTVEPMAGDGAAPPPSAREDQAAAPAPRTSSRLRAWLLRAGLAIRRRPAPAVASTALDARPPGDQGIDCLLLRLRQEREGLQPAVLEALDDLDASGVIDRMAEWARRTQVRARERGALSRSSSVYAAAYLHATLRCDEVLVHAPALADPLRIADHHAMRIATKRLRYTLELFAPLYDDELKAELRELKRLQEALGDLHDCDVWIARLPRFLDEERERTIAYFGNDSFYRFVEPGIRRLQAEKVTARDRIHADALTRWAELEREGYCERLLPRLALARDEALLPPAALRPIAEGTGTARIALVADIHGNLSALEAVLRDATARGAAAVINAGDSVGHGGDPGGVVRRLVAVGSVDVAGEWDRKVARAARRDGQVRSGHDRGAAARAADAMDPAGIAYLSGLPGERRFSLRGTRFLVVHRPPGPGKNRLPAGLESDDLDGLAASSGVDVLIVGHTHRPLVRAAGAFVIVNPGSVGRAAVENGTPSAEYALLQLSPFDLTLLRVPYGDGEAHTPTRIEAGTLEP